MHSWSTRDVPRAARCWCMAVAVTVTTGGSVSLSTGEGTSMSSGAYIVQTSNAGTMWRVWRAVLH